MALAMAWALPAWAGDDRTGPGYSPQNKAILDAVVDFDLWRIDPALTVLTDRAEYLAGLPQADWPGLDSPDYRNLLNDPAHYRGRNISLTIQPMYLKPVVFTALSDISAEKKLWRLDGFVAAAQNPADQPVSIFLIANPQSILGVTSTADTDDQINCATGRAVTISGLFYKTYSDTSRGDHTQGPTQRNYPVIIGWNIFSSRADEAISIPTVPSQNWIAIGIVILLGAAYVALRVYTTGRAAKAKSTHRPEVTRTDSEIDPDLVRAARQHRDSKARQ